MILTVAHVMWPRLVDSAASGARPTKGGDLRGAGGRFSDAVWGPL